MNGGLLVQGDRLWFGLHLVQGTVFEADLSGRVLRMIEFGAGVEVTGVGGLARDPLGRLYVADPPGQRLRVFSPEGAEVGRLGADRVGAMVDQPGVLEDPNDVAVDAEGNVYVACGEQYLHHGLQKFSPHWQFQRSFPSLGEPHGAFGGPRGLALDRAGDLLVCDTLHHRIQRFDREGRFLGVQADGLTSPVAVEALPDGDLLVAEKGRVGRLDPAGQRRSGFAPRRLVNPVDLCLAGGEVWVLERDFGEFGVRISRFDLAGNLLGQPVADLEDLVRKATAWLKSQGAWHKIGALHHYVLPGTAGAGRMAAACYERALRLDPEAFEARVDLAELWRKGNRRAEALELYRECLRLRPEDDTVRLRLASLLRQEGQPEEAVRVLRQGPGDSLPLREELARLGESDG